MEKDFEKDVEKCNGDTAPRGKDARRANMKMLYIKSAEAIIRHDGIKGLNIRKIADDVGYNSATLYNYFEDLDELILFATFKFRKQYLARMSAEITADMTALEQYIKLYEIYCEYAFAEPEVYYNMYFGKYSYRLRTVMEEYYSIFPEEFLPQTELINDVLVKGDVFEGEIAAGRHLVREGVIKAENSEMAAKMVVRIHASYMHDLCIYPHLGADACRREFLACLRHIIKTN